MGAWDLFRSKSRKAKLEEKYNRLLEQSMKAENSDVSKGAALRAEADKVMFEIVMLEKRLKAS